MSTNTLNLQESEHLEVSTRGEPVSLLTTSGRWKNILALRANSHQVVVPCPDAATAGTVGAFLWENTPRGAALAHTILFLTVTPPVPVRGATSISRPVNYLLFPRNMRLLESLTRHLADLHGFASNPDAYEEYLATQRYIFIGDENNCPPEALGVWRQIITQSLDSLLV